MQIPLRVIALRKLWITVMTMPLRFASDGSDDCRFDLGKEPAKTGNTRYPAGASDTLEGGPERRLVGIDGGLSSFALDGVDRLDLRCIGATQEKTVGGHA